MGYPKSSSIYSLIVGIMMLCMWLFFIITGMVPEFDTKPTEIILHLFAELTTAVALIISGIVTLKGLPSGKWLFPFSIGMLMYTLIVSPGYYVQSGDYLFVVMFGLLIILSIVFLFKHLRGQKID